MAGREAPLLAAGYQSVRHQSCCAVYDPERAEPAAPAWEGATNETVCSLEWLPDGDGAQLLATGTSAKWMRIYDTR
eukprot:1094590-Prorocentrum_lima.AAC.1